MDMPQTSGMESLTDTRRILDQMRTIIRGKDEVLFDCLTCLLAGGHLLIEDIPGVGKTTLAYALSKSIGGQFSRVQFTSDLFPSDITGISVYEPNTKEFKFHPGPIFANIVLADEINRTTPKTQSSLLECMERSSISVEGETHKLPHPFMVIATQNPLDFEGTYPLPENQLDRFLMRISVGYPELEYEKQILERTHHHYDDIDIEPCTSPEAILKLQKQVEQVHVEEDVLEYLIQWVRATRDSSAFRFGISTRGAIALKKVSQSRALLSGRKFVIPDDIKQSILPVFAHRLIAQRSLDGRKEIEGELLSLGEKIIQP